MAAPRRTPREVKTEFTFMLGQAARNGWEPKCFGNPEDYVDYKHMPTAEEAEEMCIECPLYSLHREWAIITKPKTGVHGGLVFVEGKQAHSARSAGMLAGVPN